MIMNRHLGVSRALFAALIFTTAICTMLPAATAPSVRISSPKPKAIIYGVIPVVATINDISVFSYAKLSVDEVGKSLSNDNPVRFELDTTRLSNGAHKLQVAISDEAGLLALSPTVPVLVLNPAIYPPNPIATTAPSAQTVTLTAPAPTATRSDTTTTILLDGMPLVAGCAPVVDRGRTMVFLRPLITALGGNLEWDGPNHRATAVLDQRTVTFTVGQTASTLNGKTVAIDRPVVELNGHLAIPVTAWHDLFDGTIGYDKEFCYVWLRSHQTMNTAKLVK